MKRVTLKPVLNFKFILVLSAFIFSLSCEQDEIVFNVLDATNPEYIPPETTIIFALDIVTTSTMTISFEGNQDSLEYSYHLDSEDWSDWTTNTSATFSYLTEGEHLFRVKSRYKSNDEDPSPAEHSFLVDYSRPTTLIISPSNGAVINSTTAEISWQLETGAECSYNFNNNGWSDWRLGPFVSFNYLDEGTYTFFIKSRFDPLIEEENPVSITFEVDALQGPGLRIFPLLYDVSIGDISVQKNIEISVYAEDIDRVVFGEITISVNKYRLEYIGYEKGSMLSSIADDIIIFVDNIVGSSEDEIKFTFATDFISQAGISGTGELIKYKFRLIGSSDIWNSFGSEVKIKDSSSLRNFSNDEISWPTTWKLDGKVAIP